MQSMGYTLFLLGHKKTIRLKLIALNINMEYSCMNILLEEFRLRLYNIFWELYCSLGFTLVALVVLAGADSLSAIPSATISVI